MAIDPAQVLRPGKPAEEAPRAPLAGSRSQSMHRLQVGLSGLAAMVLLVGLADIITANLQRNEARVVPEAATPAVNAPADSPARDPLADAGVVPELPTAPIAQPTTLPPQDGDDAREIR
jgi:hypothetical protein